MTTAKRRHPIRVFFMFCLRCLRMAFIYSAGFILVAVLTADMSNESESAWLPFALLLLPIIPVWLVERRAARRRDRPAPAAAAISIRPLGKRPNSQEDSTRPRGSDGLDPAAWPKRTGSPQPLRAVSDRRQAERGDGEAASPVTVAGPPVSTSSRSETVADRYRADYGAIVQASRAARTPVPRTGWIGPDDSVTVAGREIGGMVYIGFAPKVSGQGWSEPCRAYIDPSLPVARQTRDTPSSMPYWPGYSNIGAEHRALYLDWLADGRRDGTIDAGYMFLYFYGLERRYVVDDPPPEERRVILNEVLRLKELFGSSHSAQRYLGRFIDIARIKLEPIPDDPLSIDLTGWDVPLTLSLGLGARIGRGEPLSSDWLLAWFLAHPEKSLRTPATRCPNEFRETFRSLFAARFAGGLKVTKPRKMLSGTYEAASGEFTASMEPEIEGAPVPDVSGLRKPIEIAQEIADEAMEALGAYSRLVGRDAAEAGTLRGHLSLPPAIREAFPSGARADLVAWAKSKIAENGLVPVRDAVERVTGIRPEKPSKRDLTETADLLARLGIGMAPDPRFALRRPKPDEPAILFDLGREVEELEDVSRAYADAVLHIALGAFVAHADGTIADAERDALIARVRDASLPVEEERRRLMANLWWFLSVPPDMTLLRKRLKDASAADAGALRAALVAAAHADGEISPDEVSSLEKAYRALGLDPGLVYSDLHAGGGAEAPVAVRPARGSASGEAIPQDDAATAATVRPTTLDLDRVAAIRSDTARVSSVLGSIFTDEAEEVSVPAPSDEGGASDTGSLAGLDAAHGRLVTMLLTREHWDEDAFTALCQAEGLMPAGALETINEWSFSTHDEALIDAYEGYDVEPEIAAILRVRIKTVPTAGIEEVA